MQKLTEKVDSYLTQNTRDSKPRDYFWATDSSVESDGVKGKCLRTLYYEWTGCLGESPDALSLRRMQLGKDVEIRERSRYRKMKILQPIERKRRITINQLQKDISCEIDAPVIFNNRLEIVEIKSFYGYYATKEICGYFERGSWVGGRPKIGHLLQGIVYLNVYKETDSLRIVYIARDSEKNNEFVIRLHDKGVVVNDTLWPYSFDMIIYSK